MRITEKNPSAMVTRSKSISRSLGLNGFTIRIDADALLLDTQVKYVDLWIRNGRNDLGMFRSQNQKHVTRAASQLQINE